jgi:hypothetical protein
MFQKLYFLGSGVDDNIQKKNKNCRYARHEGKEKV